MALTRTNAHTKSLIEILNSSFDREKGVLVFQPVTTNPISGNVERETTIQGNGNLTLTYDGSNQLTTIEKTIEGVTYTKTLTWDSGVLVAVSAWEEV